MTIIILLYFYTRIRMQDSYDCKLHSFNFFKVNIYSSKETEEGEFTTKKVAQLEIMQLLCAVTMYCVATIHNGVFILNLKG